MPLFTGRQQIAGRSAIFTCKVSRVCTGVLAVCFLFNTAAFAQSESDSKSDDTNSVQQHTTPAGHKYWYYPMPDAARTAVAVSWAQEVPLDDNEHPSIARLAIKGACVIATIEDASSCL